MEPKNELQRNAIALVRRKELESYQRAQDIQWLNSRMEDCRMGRCLALIQREAEMEKEFQERTDHAAIVNAQAEYETKLGIEIAKVRSEEACQLLRRHYLWERDPTLKALVKKLEAGYVCRDVQQQILHNEYRKLQEKAEQTRANDILLNAIYNDKEAKEQEERIKMERSSHYCNELQQQLVNRQQVKQCQYEESLIEKKMLEDIMKTIADEDQRELKQRREQMEKMRNEMETFQKAKEAWKEKQKKLIVAEERQIEEQQKAAADRSSAVIAERQRKQREKEEINQKITDKLLADEASRQDRENIIKMLQEQEYLEKNFQEDVTEKEKMERVKRETKEALTRQMEGRRQLAREEKEKEAEFRREIEAKMAAEEAQEREKNRKLREKGREYSRHLLAQMHDNARKRERDRHMEEGRAQQVFDCDRSWRSEVAEERKKIIKEHAPHLIGYLQAGVIEEEDLPAIREGAGQHKHLATLGALNMATPNRQRTYSKCNPQCRVLREY